jgi:hypothetical protein
MLTRLTIVLDQDERAAIEVLALQEMRGLRDQIRFVLREAVQQRGLLLPGQVKQGRELNHE